VLRSFSFAAVAGGLCWIVSAVLNVAAGSNDDERIVLSGSFDYLLFVMFASAFALTVPGLLALHAHQRGADGRLGRVGAVVAAVGVGAQFVVIATLVANGGDGPWFDVAAPLAILTWFVGSIALGVAIRRAGQMPGWVGIALPIVTLFAIATAEYGTSVAIGVFLIVVGLRIAKATRAGTPAGRAPTSAVRG
jgi:hypothetical protein